MPGQPGNLAWYLSLVTSEHNQRPNFMATLAFLLAPVCSLYTLVQSIPSLYDIDQAVGAQLDAVGEWIGASRIVTAPLLGVYFTLDTSGLGVDGPGVLFGGTDSATSTQTLLDPQYRTLLRAKIAINHWDGTLAGLYAAMQIWLNPLGLTLLVHDNQNMTISLTLAGNVVDLITEALFLNGELTPHIMGVGVASYAFSGTSGPLFAVDGPIFSTGGAQLTAGVDQGHLVPIV